MFFPQKNLACIREMLLFHLNSLEIFRKMVVKNMQIQFLATLKLCQNRTIGKYTFKNARAASGSFSSILNCRRKSPAIKVEKNHDFLVKKYSVFRHWTSYLLNFCLVDFLIIICAKQK